MGFWLDIAKLFVAVFVGVLGSNGYWSYKQSKDKKKSAEYRMILGLGHAKIFDVAEKYIRRGAITSSELEDLEKYLFKPYSEMGGNGTAEAMVKKCRDLDIISEAEAERRDKEHDY